MTQYLCNMNVDVLNMYVLIYSFQNFASDNNLLIYLNIYNLQQIQTNQEILHDKLSSVSC